MRKYYSLLTEEGEPNTNTVQPTSSSHPASNSTSSTQTNSNTTQSTDHFYVPLYSPGNKIPIPEEYIPKVMKSYPKGYDRKAILNRILSDIKKFGFDKHPNWQNWLTYGPKDTYFKIDSKDPKDQFANLKETVMNEVEKAMWNRNYLPARSGYGGYGNENGSSEFIKNLLLTASIPLWEALDNFRGHSGGVKAGRFLSDRYHKNTYE